MFTATQSIVSMTNDDHLTILIADDDPAMRSILHHVLEHDGYVIREAEDGLGAVEASQTTRPDIILMDGKMPKMDGITACQKIRAQPDSEQIPILMLTAFDDDDSIRRAFEAGVTDYMTKPFNTTVLRQRVRRLVQLARAEAALHFTDALLTNLLKASVDACVLFDAALQIQVFNPAAERIFGYPAAEILGHNIRCLVPDVVRLQQVDWIAALVSGQQSFAVSEHRQEIGRHKDGRAIPLEISLGRIEAKERSLFAFIAEDITERQAAERALRESEWHLRDTLENIQLLVAQIDLQGYITFCNNFLLKVTGWTREDLIGTNWSEICQSAQTGHNGNECFLVTHRGERRLVTLSNSPIRDREGNVTGVTCVGEDITKRRQTEAALLREKDFSDAIINSLPGIFYLWDGQERLVRRNKNHELAFGYSAEEFEQLRLLDLIAAEDRDFISRKLEEVYTGLESQGDAQLLTRSGEKLPYRLTGSSVHIENKTYLMGVGIDISQQKKAENEIRQRTAQLEALHQTSLEIVAELEFEFAVAFDSGARNRSIAGNLGRFISLSR